jgi:shikimate dehydrogenase
MGVESMLPNIGPSRRFLVFLGRDAARSLAVTAFPAWMAVLKEECELVCVNMPPNMADREYVALIHELRSRPGCVGMQVTNHKVALFQAARQEFDGFSGDCTVLEEAGGIVITDNRLIGISPDSAAFRREFGNHRELASSVEVVLLGGGGAARAVVLVASTLPGVQKISVTEVNPRRRLDFSRWVSNLGPDLQVHIDVLPADANDELVSCAGNGALIVNASGMGKDVEGSPVSSSVEFPQESTVWDLNYRGQLDFLVHARQQAEAKRLRIIDGFSLFISNWTWLLENVLRKQLNDQDRSDLWQATQLIRTG